jgi:hypothetical protein
VKIIPASEFKLEREVEVGTAEHQTTVTRIIDTVRRDGDAALRRYAQQFDGVTVDALLVGAEELEAAYAQVDAAFLAAIRQAAANIRAFHEKQKRTSWFDLQPSGTMLGQIVRPLRRVGLYVPGGKAAYPSSVLMNAIPAQVAGVPEIVMVTPPATAGAGEAGIDPHILVAAAEAGVREIYRVGGAQAIAALAYGTESIRPVDKIVHPLASGKHLQLLCEWTPHVRDNHFSCHRVRRSALQRVQKRLDNELVRVDNRTVQIKQYRCNHAASPSFKLQSCLLLPRQLVCPRFRPAPLVHRP